MIDFPGNSLTIELARKDLERKTSEGYKGFIVRSRLKKVLNEAVKSNATVCEEEVRRFPDWYIDSIKSPDGCVLRANHEIRDAFRVHFRDYFAHCPDLLLQEFRSYLVNFLWLGVAEAASDVLKQVGCNKLPGLDGLPYEVYLRLLHMFVPILMDIFNQ